jgi:uncharacterized membrane protein
MAIGPVEYVVIAFPGSEFTGEIAPALDALIRSGTIRLLDLVFIAKDTDGSVLAVEFDEHESLTAYRELDGEVGGLIGSEDIEHAAADIEPGSSAALLVWEDVWATPLAEAIRRAGGVVLEGSRIPHDLIEPALDKLASAV